MTQIGEIFGTAPIVRVFEDATDGVPRTSGRFRFGRGIMLGAVMGIAIWVGMGFLVWHMWF